MKNSRKKTNVVFKQVQHPELMYLTQCVSCPLQTPLMSAECMASALVHAHVCLLDSSVCLSACLLSALGSACVSTSISVPQTCKSTSCPSAVGTRAADVFWLQAGGFPLAPMDLESALTFLCLLLIGPVLPPLYLDHY